jgi:hypothetical protein
MMIPNTGIQSIDVSIAIVGYGAISLDKPRNRNLR